MTAVREMSIADVRYFTTISGILECFHYTPSPQQASSGHCILSTITVLSHNHTPTEFADALQSAALWFLQVDSGDIKPARSAAPHSHIGKHVPPAPPTHCPHGHEYTPENTYHRPGRQGIACRTCAKNRPAKSRPIKTESESSAESSAAGASGVS